MNDSLTPPVLDFSLPKDLEAHEPPEMRPDASRRDTVRLLVGRRQSGTISHHEFRDLPDLLWPGDLLVVNTSATLPAAIHLDKLSVHFSTPLPDADEALWLVELRRRTGKASIPYNGGSPNEWIPMPGGVTLTLLRRQTDRLWAARLSTSVVPYLYRHGVPIRYGYVREVWPTSTYQTVFANALDTTPEAAFTPPATTPTEPATTSTPSATGSAEMPSAARPFTTELVTRLVSRGILMAPITLHTGVASPEAHEPPYAERFEVPAVTAGLVEHVRAQGPGAGRVIAVGTTVVRALETAVDGQGKVRPSQGWTEHIVTPERGVRAVDGLLTGLHEPRSSHLMMLAAIGGDDLIKRTYESALAERYLWHEFGDTNLILPR